MTHSAPFTAVSICPDLGMIESFAQNVFGYVDGLVAVRMLAETGATARAPWIELFPADERLGQHLAACAARAAGDARALYVVPATLKERGRATADNIAETAVLLCDLDAGDIAAKRSYLVEHLGPPTLEVASGGVTDDGARKLHLYWRLTEAARGDDLQIVARLRSTLATKAGADGSFQRLTQPIRVAGSLHGKVRPPVLVEIIESRDRDHDLAELAARIDSMKPLALSEAGQMTARTASVTPRVDELKSMQVRCGGLDGITRFEALSKVIGHWLRRVRGGEIDLDAAWAAVRDHNVALIIPPWEEARLRHEFDALHRRDLRTSTAVPVQHANASPITEDSLAISFVEQYGEDWRHVAASKRWTKWAGDRWVPDDTRAIVDRVRGLCRAATVNGAPPHDARRVRTLKTISAVERLAATDPAIAVTPSAFDAHPMLLNTPGGVIDLDSGEILSCRRDLLMTRQTGASPGGTSPRWLEFIDEITGGDPEQQAYLRRLAGYCLTGSVDEQVFVFLHGHGANGKSVFVNTLIAALGDYGKVAPFETFAASSHGAHPTDLAGLCGARMVVVAETERDRAWAESRIKSITGGDPISARFMRGDFFEYRPTFKLIIAGNHRPRLESFGEAMRRRLHLVPFDVTIPKTQRDPALQGRLLGELDGVLSWMIAGCAEWRDQGLAPPARISAAAEAYFEDEDVVGRWIAARCDIGDDRRSTSATLFADWSAFAEAEREFAGSQRRFAGELTARGFRSVRSSRSRDWSGIALRHRGATS